MVAVDAHGLVLALAALGTATSPLANAADVTAQASRRRENMTSPREWVDHHRRYEGCRVSSGGCRNVRICQGGQRGLDSSRNAVHAVIRLHGRHDLQSHRQAIVR